MKSILKLTAALALTSGLGMAGTVTVATTGAAGDVVGGTARGVYDLSGAAIPGASGFTAVGYFASTVDSSYFATTFAADIEANFRQLGSSGTFGVDVGGGNVASGLFSLAGSAAITSGTNADFIGQDIYAVVGNGSSIATSTELMVIMAGQQFAADNPAFNASVNLQAGDGTVIFGSEAYDGSGGILLSFGGTDYTGAANSYQTAAVLIPEPSVALLGALGLLGVVRRRRR